MSVFNTSIQAFLKPIWKYIEDESVTEVMINGHKTIFIEQRGQVTRADAEFEDANALMAAVRNISQFVGRPISADRPFLDARLPDGSRIHAVVPPIAKNGTTVAIRKFSKDRLLMKDLINKGSLTADAARFIDVCIYLKKNLMVSGGTGSGKTTILNIIASRCSPGHRILVIEDSSELRIHNEHVVYFEARPADEYGKGEVTLRDLVKSSLRLRPDRVIIGEVRGGEALDLLQSMNTGHSGSMGTVHSNSPKECLTRLETLCLMNETEVPVSAIRAQVASAIHIVVQLSRLSDGSRRTTHISECYGMDLHGNYLSRDIFIFEQQGKTREGKIIGELLPTGNLPSFMREIEVNQLPFPKAILTDGKIAKTAKRVKDSDDEAA